MSIASEYITRNARQLLERFCADTAPFDKPFLYGGWMYATDRIICVRVRCAEPDDDLTHAQEVAVKSLPWERFDSDAPQRNINEGGDGWGTVYHSSYGLDITVKVGRRHYPAGYIIRLWKVASDFDFIDFIDDDHEFLAVVTVEGLQALICPSSRKNPNVDQDGEEAQPQGVQA